MLRVHKLSNTHSNSIHSVLTGTRGWTPADSLFEGVGRSGKHGKGRNRVYIGDREAIVGDNQQVLRIRV